MDDKVKKVLQKRFYDLLSHKYGILTIVVGIFLLSISAFHFGEAWLEWSKEKYEVVFHSFSDNIAGKSFRERLSLPVPIDVVYTWVNGTDPDTKKQLEGVKSHLQTRTNLTRLKMKVKDREAKCSYTNCLPVGAVIHPALSDSITLSDLPSRSSSGSIFSNVTSIVQMRLSPDVPANLTLLLQEQHADRLVHHFGKGWSFQGTNHTVQQAYYTSDTTLTHGMAVPLLVMVTGFPSQDYTKDKLEASLKTSLKVDEKTGGLDLTVHWDKGVALLKASDKAQFDSFVNNENVTIEGKVLRLAPVTLVWDLFATAPDTEIADYRFQDKEELRYSLRSLERFAPWIRHVFIVTNGQIPYWLNMDNPRLTVVTHKEIFLNASHLPTFSSPAIEANLHRIPGLSNKFLYLNDDVMFGVPVWPDDFFSQATGHKVYLAWPVPNCNEGCPSTWINDGYCDKACNSTECDWDGGDCLGDKGKQIQLGAGFHGSVGSDYQGEDAYCHGGCANSWLSDKYCDQSCNTLECGFDAGDCGVENYRQLYGLDMGKKSQEYTLPPGETMAYFNLTDLLGDEGKVTGAKYGSNSAVRTAAVSNKYKVMTLLLYKGRNQTVVSFDLEYKKDNSSVKINFTVSVDTQKPKVDQNLEGKNSNATGSANNTATPLKKKTDEELQDEMDALSFSIHKQDIRFAKSITDKPPIPKMSLGPMEFEMDVLTFFKQLNLSHDLRNQMQALEDARGQGYLTDLGLKRKLHNVFSGFKQELATVVPKLKEVKNKTMAKEEQRSEKIVKEQVDSEKGNNQSQKPEHDLKKNATGIKDQKDIHSEKIKVESPALEPAAHAKLVDDKKLSEHPKISEKGKISEASETFKDLVKETKKAGSVRAKLNDKNVHGDGSFKDLKKRGKVDANSLHPRHRAQEKAKSLSLNDKNSGGTKDRNAKPEKSGDENSIADSPKDSDKDDVSMGSVGGPGRKLLSMMSFIPSSYWKNKFQVAQEKRARRNREMRTRKMADDEYLQLVSVENAGDSVHPMPWEDKMKVREAEDITQMIEDRKDVVNNAYVIDGWQGRQLLDAFGDSLRHVNQLYNKEFGFTARKALAHMPHMIDKNIMTELQERFPNEWQATSSHQIRHPKDMQFAFAFYYYVMGVTVTTSPDQVFDDIDTDKSGILSDRELRTLATKLYDLPLYLEVLTGLESMFINCSHKLQEKHKESEDSPPAAEQTELEVYYDKNMPQVSKELFLSCDPILELVKKHFTPKPKYKSTIMDDSDVAFKIIHSNVSKVVGQLDDIRKNPKKFICLNDNMDHSIEEAKTVTAVLQDFYESVLPITSQFELPRDYRNRFLHMDQLREWRSYRDWLQFWTHVALAVLIIFTILSFLGDKIENVTKRISRRLGRRSASPTSSSSPSSSSSSTSSSPPSPSSSTTDLPDLQSRDETSVFLSGLETV